MSARTLGRLPALCSRIGCSTSRRITYCIENAYHDLTSATCMPTAGPLSRSEVRGSQPADAFSVSARGFGELGFSPQRLLSRSEQGVLGKRTARLFSTSAVWRREGDVSVLPKVAADPDFVVPDAPPVPSSQLIPDGGELVLQGPSSDLATLGLGGWWPPGIFQQFLDLVHSTGIPWWASIAIATTCLRLLLFPLVVKAQRNAALMQQNLPEMQRLQVKMTDARLQGDAMASANAAYELSAFMKREGLNPLKSVLPAFAQAPIFLSVFLGLRRMAAAPVESLKEGGLWWFTDLTVPDPYYILPVLTSATFLAVIELGAETGGMSTTQMQFIRYAFRAIPFIFLPFMIKFPAALPCYWFTSNALSLVQVTVLKIPAVRSALKIPQIVKHDPDKLPIKKKGLRASFKESMHNNRITKEIEDRSRLDSVHFKQAGMGPIRKTYKYDPTKPPPQSSFVRRKSG